MKKKALIIIPFVLLAALLFYQSYKKHTYYTILDETLATNVERNMNYFFSYATLLDRMANPNVQRRTQEEIERSAWRFEVLVTEIETENTALIDAGVLPQSADIDGLEKKAEVIVASMEQYLKYEPDEIPVDLQETLDSQGEYLASIEAQIDFEDLKVEDIEGIFLQFDMHVGLMEEWQYKYYD
ncbi:hypothetical protein H0266_10540 [Halobacillus locisalis]|uniref:Uncharacterized protein n=1 Tax=Halobacillus locisalis TaxID=220753 RepID=A0A838CTR1_9BACI|nr:hypothetical protein [Halobacillus locisalis]MBA2175334.1 hypothetical protein [Halobacillus locisalis]